MAFTLYQTNFLPASAVVVPQRVYGGNVGADPNFARMMFYDNGVSGVSLGRIISGTHRMNGATEVAPLTEATRITLRLNASVTSDLPLERETLMLHTSGQALKIGSILWTSGVGRTSATSTEEKLRPPSPVGLKGSNR